MIAMKKLYKSTDKKIDGVCAGIAEFFEIDPTIVRVVYALISLFFAGIGGVVLYFILALVMPRKPFPDYQYNEFEKNKTDGNKQ